MFRPMEEKTEAVLIFGEAQRCYHAAERIFNERYPDRPISRQYLRQLIQKFQTTGSVGNAKRSGRPSLPEDKQIEIVAQLIINPMQPTSRVAAECEVSPKSVQRVLKRSKFHPYKLKMLHELTEDDPDRRLEFCELMAVRLNRNRNYHKWICFSDECTFFLNGKVNRQNVRYWSDVNPHVYRECNTQFPQKLNVWAGILGNHIIGPLFIQGNLTGPLYLDMLENTVEHLILECIEENPDEFGNMPIAFQQDGAPPHYSRDVRNYLDEHYPGRWIGRRGAIEWPARSPDLTPMDFFLWGFVKSKVFITQPQSLEDLRQRIIQVCASISHEMFHNVREEFHDRLYICQEVNGGHFEHLIK